MNPVGLLVHNRAELAQGLEVEVDGATPDRAPSELWNERLSELVQEGAAEEDRDTRGSRERVDVGAGGNLDVGGIHAQRAAILVEVDANAVQAQQVGHDVRVPNQRHVVELGGGVGQQRSDHCLGHEVLGAAHADFAAQRVSALDLQDG